jgi:hypothetical protein
VLVFFQKSYEERIQNLKDEKASLKQDIQDERDATNVAITNLCNRVSELATLEVDANEI